MDPRAGRLLALAQADLGPNNELTRNADQLKNNSVEQAFDPGSTGKVITAAAVLEEGKADASTVFNVPNRLPRPNGDGVFQFRDDVDHPLYKMTFAGVLAQSSNIRTIQAAEMIGKEKAIQYLKKFGMARKRALGSHQRTAVKYHRWKSGATSRSPNVAYGQGYSANAIQMTSVFSTIANKGVRVTPRIIDSKIDPDGTVERLPEGPTTRVVSEETTKKLMPMLEQVVLERGTAQDVAAIKGVPRRRKTGTAQLYNPKANGGKGGYSGYVASFIGLAHRQMIHSSLLP